jgi:hypothetical protein
MGSGDGNWQNVQWLTYLSSVSLMPRRPPPTKSHRYSMNLREQPLQVKTLSRFVPITGWLPGCSWKTTRGDIVAGIAVAGLLIPECMVRRFVASEK